MAARIAETSQNKFRKQLVSFYFIKVRFVLLEFTNFILCKKIKKNFFTWDEIWENLSFKKSKF